MTMIVPVILLLGLAVIGKKNRRQSLGTEIGKPDAFTQKQKINLWLIVALIVIVLSAPVPVHDNAGK